MGVLKLFGNGPGADGQAGGAGDVGEGGDQDGTGRGNLIQIAQHFDLQLALLQHIALAGKVAGFRSQLGSVGVQGFVTVGGSVADLIEIPQSLQRPAGEILAAVGGDAGKGIHIRPVLGPVGAQSHKGAVGDGAVLGLIVPDVLLRYGVAGILGDLGGDIDDAQGEHGILNAVLLGQGRVLNKMAGEVDMGAELPGELEGLDQAVKLGHTPVVDGFGQLYGAVGNAAPVGAGIIEGVCQVDKAELLQFRKGVPKRIHGSFLLCYHN